MEADLVRAIPVLRREHLFEGLDTAQIARVVRFFEQIEIDSGEVVFSEGDKPDYFYFILEGKVRITRRKRGRERLVNVLSPGDYFGEMALLFHNRRSATATCEEKVTLLRLSPSRFQLILDEYPFIRQNIAATAGSRALLRRLKFDWMGSDEVIYYITRKHPLFLVTRLVLPVIVFLLAAGRLALLFYDGYVETFELTLFGSLCILASLGFLWGWIDWSNDYYIVTSQRTVWQEKILGFFDSRREAPLDAVLSVNVSSSLIGRMFKYGNVDVRTFTGGILMRRMDLPNLFASFVEGYKKRVIAINKDQEKKLMEEALDAGLRRSHAPPKEEDLVAAEEPPAPVILKQKPKKPSRIREWLRTFMKVRYEEAGTITYRKHIFVLAKKSVLPVIVSVFAVLFLIVAVRVNTLSPIMLCYSSPVFLGLLFWFWYVYEDWRNDIYRLTPEQILDIEKKPLGREHKKTAGLDAPDFRVEHTRDTILNIIMNYGNVTVNIGQTQFTFDDVYNPDQVHQDVSDFREAFLRRKRKAEAESERERMVEWLVTFYERSEKLGNSEGDFNPGEVMR